MYCQLECNNKNGVCIDGKCYCFSIREANAERSSHNYEKSEESLQYALRPTVRHHIAHFCPNLEIARSCIRKCMVEGKPAFCGKDHVCYCGHKYKNTDINPKIDAQNVYNQFKDLYTKYFGPNVNGNKGHGENIDAMEI
ncbi:unnamed protein product [Colias eurytheme]|nr:unnamed protein product [Colias eurytheme]